MDKKQIANTILAMLEQNLVVAKKERDVAQQEANSHIGAMESRYDTFKEEAQYLVSACNRQIEALNMDIANLSSFIINSSLLIEKSSKISVGSFVKIIDDEKVFCIFILPVGGGLETEIDGEKVKILTVKAPMIKAILGKTCGEVSFDVDSKKRTIRILEIQ